MMRLLFISVVIAGAALPYAAAQELACGKVAEGHQGVIPEWPKDPVNFECERGVSELSLCILNRTGIEWLPNAGEHFIAIDDGYSVYALTRDTHPAHPMIVRRTVGEDQNGHVSIMSSGCGYGDKAASDALMAEYEAMNERIITDLSSEGQEGQIEDAD
ncbi:MAG: hypothetical protein MK186_03805 [Henriciella sp.]|nr:hypothetical protein [Henriciella sp.]